MTVKALLRQVRDRINAYNLMSYIMSCRVNHDLISFQYSLNSNFTQPIILFDHYKINSESLPLFITIVLDQKCLMIYS